MSQAAWISKRSCVNIHYKILSEFRGVGGYVEYAGIDTELVSMNSQSLQGEGNKKEKSRDKIRKRNRKNGECA